MSRQSRNETTSSDHNQRYQPSGHCPAAPQHSPPHPLSPHSHRLTHAAADQAARDCEIHQTASQSAPHCPAPPSPAHVRQPHTLQPPPETAIIHKPSSIALQQEYPAAAPFPSENDRKHHGSCAAPAQSSSDCSSTASAELPHAPAVPPAITMPPALHQPHQPTDCPPVSPERSDESSTHSHPQSHNQPTRSETSAPGPTQPPACPPDQTATQGPHPDSAAPANSTPAMPSAMSQTSADTWAPDQRPISNQTHPAAPTMPPAPARQAPNAPARLPHAEPAPPVPGDSQQSPASSSSASASVLPVTPQTSMSSNCGRPSVPSPESHHRLRPAHPAAKTPDDTIPQPPPPDLAHSPPAPANNPPVQPSAADHCTHTTRPPNHPETASEYTRPQTTAAS